jgi:hypothetical protein
VGLVPFPVSLPVSVPTPTLVSVPVPLFNDISSMDINITIIREAHISSNSILVDLVGSYCMILGPREVSEFRAQASASRRHYWPDEFSRQEIHLSDISWYI